jgi:hypothetical protein
MPLPDLKDANHGKMTTMKPLTTRARTTRLYVALHVVEGEEAELAEEDVDEAALQAELGAQLLVCKSSSQPL